MQNLRFLIRNIADTATLTTPLATASDSLAVANLQRQTERGRTWRSGSLADQDLNCAWTSDQRANMIALTRTNLSTAATRRNILYSAGSPSVSVYDSGALSAFSTSGLDTKIDTYTDTDFRGYRISREYFPLVTNMRYATTRLSDAANADGYIEATRLWIGEYFQVTYDPPYGGADLTLMDASTSGRSDDGTHLVHRMWKARKLQLKLEFIPDADVATLLAMCRYLGKHTELFVSLYPEAGGVKELYNQMACRIVDSPIFNPWQVGLHRNTITLEET